MDFKTRRVSVDNRLVHVMCQETRGTSALSSLSNCLLLADLLSLESGDTTSSFMISTTDLTTMISSYSLQKAKLCLPATPENKARVEKFWGIIKTLPMKNPRIRPAPDG